MAHRLFLLFGDFILLYLSLAATLLIRYGVGEFFLRLGAHLLPFSLLFLGWLFIFFIADLYSPRVISSSKTLFQRLSTACFFNIVASVFAFYLFGPIFSLTPKTNLFLFALFSFSCIGAWRMFTLRVSPRGKTRVLFLGASSSVPPLIAHLSNHPHLGYETLLRLERPSAQELQETLSKIAPDLIVFSSDAPPTSPLFRFSRIPLFPSISFLPFQEFYASIFEKISLADIDENWITKCLTRQDRAYDAIKRLADLLIAAPATLLFLPLMALLAIFVRALSPGPAVFTQKRMGRGSQAFTLYKFRTMYAGSDGPLWTEPHDKRVTPFGRFLRFTHLDELPQLFNILRGDISLTGPRPERYELAEEYRKLPYYDLRHLVKPGLTGWAQINFRPSASLEEAKEKLAYDLYYIAYRSFSLDLILIAKTMRHFFFSHF
ncbi:MAG: exopolysaccharide biosynthesis polyprenyl glycosylphosphotransferase [Patescibacteria group bacterium]